MAFIATETSHVNDVYYFNELEKYRAQDKAIEFYEHMAPHYETILDEAHFYCIQEYAAKLLKEHVCREESEDYNPRILDAGCGPGKSGIVLTKEGFKNIDGLDASQKMLDIASDKKIYSNLIKDMISEEKNLSCADNTYDGVFCIYGITRRQMRCRPAVNEFCRITKPGGYAVFSISPTIQAEEYMGVLTELISSDVIELMLLTMKEYTSTSNNLTWKSYVCVIKVL